MSERFDESNAEERRMNRVEVVDLLSQIADVHLKDFIGLNDRQVLTKIRKYADQWGWDEHDLFEVCGVDEYLLKKIEGENREV